MTKNKRFTIEIIEDKDVFIQRKGAKHFLGVNGYVNGGMVVDLLNDLSEENEQLKASLYAEKTNTAEVVNDYSKQFKRHSAQFSFMMDLADDLGVDVTTLEALDD